ncbi:MAG TPA: hypothetical protein VE268_11345 [Herpetosiphonaceae bacterium]|nr:hypothetical protein [Herpetosiphonaceae bacterium]
MSDKAASVYSMDVVVNTSDERVRTALVAICRDCLVMLANGLPV